MRLRASRTFFSLELHSICFQLKFSFVASADSPLDVLLFKVLSRTPELNEDIYKELLDHATNEGYDVSKLQRTAQLPGVGEDGNSSNAEDNSDKVGIWWLKSLFGK